MDLFTLTQLASIDEYSDLAVTAYGGSTYIDDLNSGLLVWVKNVTNLDATDFIFT